MIEISGPPPENVSNRFHPTGNESGPASHAWLVPVGTNPPSKVPLLTNSVVDALQTLTTIRLIKIAIILFIPFPPSKKFVYPSKINDGFPEA
jgi:hypothetical protein